MKNIDVNAYSANTSQVLLYMVLDVAQQEETSDNDLAPSEK